MHGQSILKNKDLAYVYNEQHGLKIRLEFFHSESTY